MKEREKTLWDLPSTGSFPRYLQQCVLGQPEAGSQEVGAHSGSPMLGGKDFYYSVIICGLSGYSFGRKLAWGVESGLESRHLACYTNVRS